jgi:hypothetical protein
VLSALRYAMQQQTLLPGTCLSAHRYTTELEGLRKAEALVVDDARPHVIIGPTDSGVFHQFDLTADRFANAKVTVVSPLVTAEIGNDPDGWLFRTNVSARVRASTLHTFLSQRKVTTIAVVYADSEFGLRAEEEFRNGLSLAQTDRYVSIRYKNIPELRRAAKQLAQSRPAAVGVLGPREDVGDFFESFRQSSHGINPYWPISFTAVDTKLLQLEDVYYVSLDRSPGIAEAGAPADEVSGLAYDTTTLVLRVMPTDIAPGSAEWRNQFRRNIVGLLEGPSSEPGAKTQMAFRGLQNAAKPAIYSYTDDGIERMILDPPPGFFSQLFAGPQLILRQHGLAPIWNLLALMVIVSLITRADVRSWCDIENAGENLRRAMTGLIVFNVSVAVLVYLGLIYLNVIEWRNFMGMITVAFGYPMLLKSKLGETATGKVIGFAQWYEGALARVEDRVADAMYGDDDSVIDFIAAASPIDKLHSVLVKRYSYRRPERATQLIAQLDKDIAEADGKLAARRICARRIRMGHKWEDLVRLKLVPDGIEADELIPPEEMLEWGVDYCTGRGRKPPEELKKDVEQALKEAQKVQGRDVSSDRRELAECLQRSGSDRGRARCYLRWIFLKLNYRVADIIKHGYLPDEAMYWKKGQPMQDMVTIDRRADQRFKLEVRGSVIFFDTAGNACEPIEATVVDISGGGAFIRVQGRREAEVDTTGVEFLFDEDRDRKGRGTWLRHYRQGANESFALAWDDVSPQLEEWIKALSQPPAKKKTA